eukprot:CAMPEP_0168560532 /NCGR_PEP_ID=MMETSP0413-20121227/11110_1 /TAXON_ID=136452 /ORGANISM="Filamoeba nolandi, Strain NC-AS-23-1" /LENGTH=642 /DNA_ID=CAMNT_0008591839 /DNA_START=293 /DNA_END=2217 /DNA_ORIENTATION=+
MDSYLSLPTLNDDMFPETGRSYLLSNKDLIDSFLVTNPHIIDEDIIDHWKPGPISIDWNWFVIKQLKLVDRQSIDHVRLVIVCAFEKKKRHLVDLPIPFALLASAPNFAEIMDSLPSSAQASSNKKRKSAAPPVPDPAQSHPDPTPNSPQPPSSPTPPGPSVIEQKFKFQLIYRFSEEQKGTQEEIINSFPAHCKPDCAYVPFNKYEPEDFGFALYSDYHQAVAGLISLRDSKHEVEWRPNAKDIDDARTIIISPNPFNLLEGIASPREQDATKQELIEQITQPLNLLSNNGIKRVIISPSFSWAITKSKQDAKSLDGASFSLSKNTFKVSVKKSYHCLLDYYEIAIFNLSSDLLRLPSHTVASIESFTGGNIGSKFRADPTSNVLFIAFADPQHALQFTIPENVIRLENCAQPLVKCLTRNCQVISGRLFPPSDLVTPEILSQIEKLTRKTQSSNSKTHQQLEAQADTLKQLRNDLLTLQHQSAKQFEDIKRTQILQVTSQIALEKSRSQMTLEQNRIMFDLQTLNSERSVIFKCLCKAINDPSAKELWQNELKKKDAEIDALRKNLDNMSLTFERSYEAALQPVLKSLGYSPSIPPPPSSPAQAQANPASQAQPSNIQMETDIPSSPQVDPQPSSRWSSR